VVGLLLLGRGTLVVTARFPGHRQFFVVAVRFQVVDVVDVLLRARVGVRHALVIGKFVAVVVVATGRLFRVQRVLFVGQRVTKFVAARELGLF